MKTSRQAPKAKPTVGKSMGCDARIARLLRSVETLDVTAEELTAFDDSSFTTPQPDEGPSMADPTKILAKINDAVATEVRREPQAEIVEGALFDGNPASGFAGEPKFHFEVSRKRFTSLVPL